MNHGRPEERDRIPYGLYPVLSNEPAGGGTLCMRLEAPEIARAVLPGQFIAIRCGVEHDPLLRRPFSVYAADPSSGTVDILYVVVGRGTRWLRSRRAGDRIDTIGPLGNHFDEERIQEGRRIYLVGGRTGVAPLALLARRLASRPCDASFLVGARTREELPALEELRRVGIPLVLATEDGSLGTRGRVTELLELQLDGTRPQDPIVYGCGPPGMNESLRVIARRRRLSCQISIECVMACGIGICYGCSIPTANASRKRVCRDGPVFECNDLLPGITEPALPP